jgi:uncharacterized protein YecE (DUF72 family)
MGRILGGTASWTDKTLIVSGRFYASKDNTSEGRLRCYASQFPLVEDDSSYYAYHWLAWRNCGAERRSASFLLKPMVNLAMR